MQSAVLAMIDSFHPNDLECLFHVKIRFRPARLSHAYLALARLSCKGNTAAPLWVCLATFWTQILWVS